jgi:sugar phosphate isomerase/epimerase
MSTIGAKPSPAPAADAAALSERLGLSVPHEWWPSAPLLKSYEAAGFDWVQLHSPPPSVLRDHHFCTRHGAAVAEALATTSLAAVVHAPAGLRLGDRDGDRAFEGLLSYAAEIGAAQIVYHAMALPDAPAADAARAAEERSLEAGVALAERLEITIAIENLAPVYPGPETLAASPVTLRSLVQRIGSDNLALCLDLGHAQITADLRHTGVERLCEPVLDLVSVFHVHDNLGARWTRAGDELGVDPLRLDLHLPPGRGTLPWDRVASLLADHRAPLLLEVHPPHRPRASELVSSALRLFG